MNVKVAVFRKISEQVRHDMACHLLKKGEFSVIEVAERLGYADSTSFVGAFKAMGGVSPGRYVG